MIIVTVDAVIKPEFKDDFVKLNQDDKDARTIKMCFLIHLSDLNCVIAIIRPSRH